MADSWHVFYYNAGDPQPNPNTFTFVDYQILTAVFVADGDTIPTPPTGFEVEEISEADFDAFWVNQGEDYPDIVTITAPPAPLNALIFTSVTPDLTQQKLDALAFLRIEYGRAIQSWMWEENDTGSGWQLARLQAEVERYTVDGGSAPPYPLMDAHVGTDLGATLADVHTVLDAQFTTMNAGAVNIESEFAAKRDEINAAADESALDAVIATIPFTFTYST